TEKMSTWTYPYLKAPLIRDLVNYLKGTNEKEYMTATETKLQKYQVPIEKYYTKDEHIQYVTPLVFEYLILVDDVNEELESRFQKTTYYFQKISKMLVQQDKNVVKYLDCQGALYTSKCHFLIEV